MLARARTFALDGLESTGVSVEVNVRSGLPAFLIVGLGDTAVREARERVRAAIVNSGFDFPPRRIVANLAPAHLRKEGAGFDLALACATLAASGQLATAALDRWALFGELSLTGEVRACPGTLAAAEAARRLRCRGLVVARATAPEAALAEGLRVAAATSLREVVALLRGAPAPATAPAQPTSSPAEEPDLADVRGQEMAVQALAIAAAGDHNLLMYGPPGTGKTMLARRLPSILPPLSRAEALEVTRIHGIAGEHPGGGLVGARPFRSPHHTISAVGLVGGGARRRPGEASLAHRGVLFLDELSEFSRPSLEALRQPLEDGRVTIVRGQRAVAYPASFMLVAATNPCPCGLEDEMCRCTEADFARHRRRLSGPVLDRMDLVVHVGRPKLERLQAAPSIHSAEVRERVLTARERRSARRPDPVGAACGGDRLKWAQPEARARSALAAAYERGALSARGHDRVLGVARTIADLDASPAVRLEHVLQALALRQDAAFGAQRAA
ncbi:MAG: ATP-binding protein [Actinobacteria bacterium]|nr:MAG: ATP-binding protein [Actinomycetota bacterium]